MTSIDALVAAAQLEIDEEDRRKAIDEAKASIRARRNRSIWSRLFPFKITVTRID